MDRKTERGRWLQSKGGTSADLLLLIFPSLCDGHISPWVFCSFFDIKSSRPTVPLGEVSCASSAWPQGPWTTPSRPRARLPSPAWCWLSPRPCPRKPLLSSRAPGCHLLLTVTLASTSSLRSPGESQSSLADAAHCWPSGDRAGERCHQPPAPAQSEIPVRSRQTCQRTRQRQTRAPEGGVVFKNEGVFS